MQYAERGTIGYAHINALSWRVASELSRRDPALLVGPASEGSAAHTDSLLFVDGKGLMYQARRRGLGFAVFRNLSHGQIKWDRAFQMHTAREIAVALERSVGIQLPERAPATNRRSLSYRVVASILEMTVGDKHLWVVEPGSGGSLDPAQVEEDPKRLREFEDIRWVLLRNEDAVANVDTHGYAEIDGRIIDLYARYNELGRRITTLTAEVFGGIMP